MDESLNELCTLFDLAKPFDTNMTRHASMAHNLCHSVFVPHALALFGSLFLHFDFLSVFPSAQLRACFLTPASLYSGVANAVNPL
jgi:hypothetical protein